MDRVSRKGERKRLSIDTLYDAIVFIYIIALFVLENAKYSQLFSMIQILFFGFSAFMMGRYVKASFCLKWCVSVFFLAFILAFINYGNETTSTLIIVLKNMLKCFFFYTYVRDDCHIEKLIKYVGIAGVICGFSILAEFFASDMSYTNLKYATISRIGADIAGGNVNIVGMNMCIAFASWLYIIGRIKKQWIKALAFSVMAFILVTSLLTGSRKILVFYVITFVIANLQSNKRNLIFVIGGLGVLYIAVMEIEPLYFLVGHKIDFFGGNTAYTMYQQSDENRLHLAVRGLSTFASSPWGIGFGNSSKYLGSYAHNNFIEVLVSGGLIGFLAYYSSYFYSIYTCTRKKSLSLAKYVIYSAVGMLLLEIGQVTYLYSVPMVFLSLIMAISENIRGKAGAVDRA